MGLLSHKLCGLHAQPTSRQMHKLCEVPTPGDRRPFVRACLRNALQLSPTQPTERAPGPSLCQKKEPREAPRSWLDSDYPKRTLGSVLDRHGGRRSARMFASDRQMHFTSHSTCRSREGCDHKASSAWLWRRSGHCSVGRRMSGDECRGFSGRQHQVNLSSLMPTSFVEGRQCSGCGPWLSGALRPQTARRGRCPT
jgi:hypothetical protein